MPDEEEHQSLLQQQLAAAESAEAEGPPSILIGAVYHSTHDFNHEGDDENANLTATVRWTANTNANTTANTGTHDPSPTTDMRQILTHGLAELTDGFTVGLDDFSKRTSTLLFSSFLISLYLLCGVVGFSLLSPQRWTIIDSLYFTAVTFTTTGYGDLVPVGNGERIFCIVFLLVGVLVLGGLVLGILFENLVESFEQMKHGTSTVLDQEFLNKFRTKKATSTTRQEQIQTGNGNNNNNNKVEEGRIAGRLVQQMSFDSSVYIAKSDSESDADSSSFTGIGIGMEEDIDGTSMYFDAEQDNIYSYPASERES